MTFLEAHNEGSLNSTTPVALVASPEASARRLVRFISVYNKDTVAIALTIGYLHNATTSIIFKGTLQTGETYIFGDGGETLVLDDTDQSITAVLGGAVTANQPEFISTYAEVTA